MPRRPASLLLLPLALSCATTAWAQSVHKCVDAGGRVSYSDMPCAVAPKPTATVPAGASTAPAPASATRPSLPVATSATRPSLPVATSAAPARAAAPNGGAPIAAASAPAPRAAANDVDPDLAARRANATQSADCTAALRQMGVAGGGMKLVEAGQARGTALSRCGGG